MKNPNFCVLPFYSFESKSATEPWQNIWCCRLPGGTNIQQVRQDIIKGHRSPSCNTCWKLEDAGLTSERNLHNSSLDFYWDKDIDLIEKDALEGKAVIRSVKLNTSNLCNGTCVTCGPYASSAWAKLRGLPIDYRAASMADLSHVPWREIKSLGFVGGEPLLSKVNFEILEHLIEIGNDSCFINIVTNGSISLSKRQIAVLSKFPNLNFCLSIDGVGQRFEYLRFPLKWSGLTDNLKAFRSITTNLSVSCMVSNLSVFYLDEILDWFQEMGLRYLAKQIDNPSYFAPGNLPPHVKQILMERTRYPQNMGAFLGCGSYTLSNWKKLWQEIDRQDRLKKISIADYLPEAAITRIA